MELTDEGRGWRRYRSESGEYLEVRVERYGYFAIMEHSAAQTLAQLIAPGLDAAVLKHLAENGYEQAGPIEHRLEEPFLVYSATGELLGPMCRVISDIAYWPPAPPEQTAADLEAMREGR